MAGIPPHIRGRLNNVLLRCEQFDTDSALKAIFIDTRIRPWRDQIPQANTPTERVQVTIDYLCRQEDVNRKNGLVLFLQVLSVQFNPSDARHRELAQLATDLEDAMTRLGKYKLLEELGQGQYAVVYKAYDTQAGHHVALKVLRPEMTGALKTTKLFKREGKIVQQLDHPHVVTVYDSGIVDGKLYIAMELASTTLRKHIHRRKQLTPERTAQILNQIADALDYVHAQNIFHRDLKPSNILLDSKKGVLVADFGLAKAIQASGSSISISRAGAGTAAYIAPEIWNGETPTAAADVYSLGCVLYEMLTGDALIGGNLPWEAVIKRHQESAKLLMHSSRLPSRLKVVLAKALMHDKRDRYRSAGKLAVAFGKAVRAEQAPRPWLDWVLREIARAERRGQWERIKQLCDEYEALQPENPRIAALRQKAQYALQPSIAPPAPPAPPKGPTYGRILGWAGAITLVTMLIVLGVFGGPRIWSWLFATPTPTDVYDTPTATLTPYPSNLTPMPTFTPTIADDTPTPTSTTTQTATPTDTPSPTPTDTPSPTPTDTPSPTPTDTPSPTPTPTIPPETVQGQVLWNEQPVEGATVYATDLYGFDSTRYGSATTDANGHFSISGIPEGKQYLYVFGNQPEFWVAAVTPFQMVVGTGTLAEDTYLCKGFDPISPQDGQAIGTSQPILQWDAYPDAVDYAVRVIRVGESKFVFQRGDHDARIPGTSVQVDVDLSPGEYRWRVDAFNAAGHIIGCSYYPRSFEVTG